MSKKCSNIYRGFIPFQSEFSRLFASWAKNHRGWSKMKKKNKRLAKRREKQEFKNSVIDDT